MIPNDSQKYDKIILGAGIFGLYAALKSIEKGQRVLEYDSAPFKRASYINQARVHNGFIIREVIPLLSNQPLIINNL